MATSPADFTDAYFEDMEDLENRHPWPRAMRRLTLDLLRRYAPSPSRILDVGCGTGGFLREWAAQATGAAATGVDFAGPALRRARRRFGAAWVQASAAELPFAEESFDGIHCTDVLQHLSLAETDRALDDFARLLRAGGVLALRVRATRLAGNTQDVDYSHAYTTRRLRDALESRGFAVRMLSRVNLAGSLWAELSTRRGPAAGAAVGGIHRERAGGLRGAVLGALLGIERPWVRAGLSLPAGHTIIALAVRGQRQS